MSWRLGVAVAFLLLFGCDGRIGSIGARSNGPGGDNGTQSGSPKCAVTDTGFQPLRRLSSTQTDNTLRELFGGGLGDTLVGIVDLPKTEIVSGFSTEANANVVNTASSNAFEDAAEVISDYLIDNASTALPLLMPCGSDSYGDSDITACVDRFIDEFGLRAYRRPLTGEEKQILRAVYDDVHGTQTATEAWAAVVQVMVQSPQFLYLAEPGADPVEGADHLVQLDDYEMASRLSYFLNNTMPDDELFAAAAADELRTIEQIEAQAQRLADKDELIDVLASFHNEWLGLYDFEGLAKVPVLFPGYDDSVRTAMAEEIRLLTEHAMNDLDGSVSSFLSATDWEVPAELAFVYGLSEAGPASAGTGPRSGALTTSAFLATHAHEDASSAIQRGVFIRRAVLCGDLAPPQVTDDQREVVLSPAAEASTARERLEPLTQTGQCSACHLAINPLGLALENFDAIGQWRDTENGVTIDPSGAIDQAADADGSFGDVTGFVELISDSSTVQYCYSEKLFRFAVGRLAAEEDGCALDELKYAADQSDGDIRELLIGMTLTHSFRYRRGLP
jgi:hypothetical protein